MATKTKKKTASPRKSSARSGNMVPVFVLIIMGLLAALVVVLNTKNDGKIEKKPATVKSVAGTESTSRVESDTPAKNTNTDDTKNIESGNYPAKIFFLKYDDKSGKITHGSAVREIKGKDNIEDAIRALIKGPSSSEEKKGLISALPKNIKVRSVTLKDGVADIDLSREFADDAHGDIATGRINQLFYTSMQFSSVKGIVVRINGKILKTLGGDGLILSWPMKKPL